MTQYIDKLALVSELKRRIQESIDAGGATRGVYLSERMKKDSYILSFIDTLEAKEVDLEIFGAIARHVIAVKEHVEDMRFDEEEWLTLEKIGYPERFESQKGEQDD